MTSPNSFLQAWRFYNLSISLSKTWISKYYPNSNFKFNGVPIEKVQAFSQHHFFSCLLQEAEVDDVWSQYPNSSLKPASSNSPKKLGLRAVNILREIFLPGKKFEGLGDRLDLIFLSSGRHLEDSLELIEHLNRQFKIAVVGKMTKESLSFFKKNQIFYLNVSSGRVFLSGWSRLKNLAHFLIQFWGKAKKHKLFDNDLWQKRLWYLRLEQFPEIAALLKVANKIFETTRPCLLLTTSSNDTFGSAFSLTAQKLGIPVAEILHGFSSWPSDRVFAHNDYHLVWGEIPQRIFSGSSKKIVIVGCPFLERKLANNSKTKMDKKIKRVLVLWSPPMGIVSLMASRVNQQTIRRLIEGLKKLPRNFTITIRSHPSYDPSRDLAEVDLGDRVRLNNKGNTKNVVAKHDLVITQPTTAGFIAALYKKPLLFFNNSWITQKYGDPLIDSESALNVPLANLEKIDRYVLNLINDKYLLKKQLLAQEKFINDYCSYFGKKSCEQIAKFAKKIIYEKSSGN